jgi:aspartokinase
MAIEPALKKNIVVHVMYSKNPDGLCTEISGEHIHSNTLVKSIAYKRPLSLLKIQSHRSIPIGFFLKTIFDALDKERMIPYVITSTESSVSMAIQISESVENFIQDLSAFGSIQIINGKAAVSLIGENLSSAGNVGSTIFQALRGIDVDMISRGVSSINFILVVNENDVGEVISRLHRVFFKNPDKQIFE